MCQTGVWTGEIHMQIGKEKKQQLLFSEKKILEKMADLLFEEKLLTAQEWMVLQEKIKESGGNL